MLKRPALFKKRIYLDYASLTPVDPRAFRTMHKYSGPNFANPSSWYKEGVAAKDAVDESRKRVAEWIGAHGDEIYWTASGTEANNLAILGAVYKLHGKGVAYEDMHVLASSIEHSSVMECLNHLNDLGVATETVPVDENGVVKMVELERMLRPNTVLVSIMTVNNEIGTIEPTKEIAKVIRKFRRSHPSKFGFDAAIHYPLFHTDAAQAGYLDIQVEKLGVDVLTLDAAKIHGPRGIGALYVRRGLVMEPVIYGGGQERGLRSGTENVAAIVAFGEAALLAKSMSEKEYARLAALRSEFVMGLAKIDAAMKFHSGPDVSPHIVNVSIPGIDNEFFVLELDAHGISCSTKSSCLRDASESYVLKNIRADSKNSVRFSFGRFTRGSDIRTALGVIRKLLGRRSPHSSR